MDSFIHPDSITPAPGKVLLEAVFSPEKGKLLYYDPRSIVRYPNLGFVVKVGKTKETSLAPNQLVLLQDEGRNTDQHSYYNVFAVDIRDHKEKIKVLVDIEVEERFRQAVKRYRANPSTDDSFINIKDHITEDWIGFNASDVEDFGFEEIAHPNWRMEYIPTYMIHLSRGPETPLILHYIVDESKIMAILNKE